MSHPTAFVRTNGNGDNIVCLHSSLGSSRQWSSLSERLNSTFRVSAIDLYGYGHSPRWDRDRSLKLDDEVALLSPVLDAMEGPIHLVGHSYGGAVTFKLAEKYADRVASLVVYEPALFSILFGTAGTQQAATEVMQLKTELQNEFRSRQYESATRKFIEYWSGIGAWRNFSWQQQAAMIDKIGMVLDNLDAIILERNTLTLLTNMAIPVLLLCGEQSPQSTQSISQLASRVLPEVNFFTMPGMGHMGPVTHSDRVNDAIENFVRRQAISFDGPGFPFAA
jgi:pimeloyl-ACP methyl ester carboxylesterase